MLCKRGLIFLFSVLFSFVFLSAAPQAQAKINPRYASIIIDADTGSILYQRYADKELYPASLAKMMTLMLVFDEIRRGRLQPNQRITISAHAANTIPSKLGLKKGATIRVQDAINILIIKSANDVAIALAEHIAGSESRFAQMMTRRALAIGMTRTKFRNASGLHDRQQVTTARDMAILARYLIRNYPREYRYFSRDKFTYRGKTYRNHNHLMRYYKGMDGLKTGYIRASGFNLAASAQRDGRRIIGIVFGGRTAQSRNQYMTKLLDLGFSRLKNYTNASYVSVAPVPAHKPGLLLASRLNNIKPAAGPVDPSPIKIVKKAGLHELAPGINWAAMKSILNRETYINMVGQGDIDENLASRMETGLLAMGALKSAGGRLNKYRPNKLQKSAYKQATMGKYAQRQTITAQLPKKGRWTVQVGAFNSRMRTDKAIQQAQAKLPDNLHHGRPLISPVKSRQNWLFRGRLYGYTSVQAAQICRILDDCMAIAPKNAVRKVGKG